MQRRSALLTLVCLIATGCGAERAGHDNKSSTDVALAAAVRVEADGCRTKASIGGGSFVDEEEVLTVAHVVAGAKQVHVLLADGTRVVATVTAIDRKKDLAVLHVEREITPLPRGTMRPGATGSFVVYRDEQAVALMFEAMSYVDINAPSIDDEGSSLRRGYQITAEVEKGDSGSVLVSNGVATGVVFARSTTTGQKAWVVDITEADELLESAKETTVDVGECS